jgi:hypothetical protein
VNQRERTELERELAQDFADMPVAVESRMDELVEKYLLWKAGKLTDRVVRGEKDILKLIHLHSRVALLEQVITRPKQFNLKEMKELFRSTLIVEANDASENRKAEMDATLIALADTGSRDRVLGLLTERAKDNLRLRIDAARTVDPDGEVIVVPNE